MWNSDTHYSGTFDRIYDWISGRSFIERFSNVFVELWLNFYQKYIRNCGRVVIECSVTECLIILDGIFIEFE